MIHDSGSDPELFSLVPDCKVQRVHMNRTPFHQLQSALKATTSPSVRGELSMM